MSGPTTVRVHRKTFAVVVEGPTLSFSDEESESQAHRRISARFMPTVDAIADAVDHAFASMPTELAIAVSLLELTGDEDDPNKVNSVRVRAWLESDAPPDLLRGRPVLLQFDIENLEVADEMTTITVEALAASLPEREEALGLGTLLRDAVVGGAGGVPRRGSFLYPRDVPEVLVRSGAIVVRARPRRQALDEADGLDLREALEGAAAALSAMIIDDVPKEPGNVEFTLWDERSDFWVEVRDRTANPKTLVKALSPIFPDVVAATADGSAPKGHEGWTLRVTKK